VTTPSDPDIPATAYTLTWKGLSGEEQMIVELVNRARMDPDGEVERQEDGFASGVTSYPKEVLAVVPELSQASEDHSEDMDNRDYFAHDNPDGEGPGARAVEAGHGTGYVGENLGWIGSSWTSFDAQARAEAHHNNLWASDGHQKNLMREGWNEIGVGYDYGDYLGYRGSTFVTEMFSDRGETYLTGVVIDDTDGDGFYDIGEGQGGVRITAYKDDEVYTTATWDAGGYTLALDPGTYRVIFEGGDLATPQEATVTMGDTNVKLDIIEGGSATLAAAADYSDEAGLTLSDIVPAVDMPPEPVSDTLMEEDDLLLV